MEGNRSDIFNRMDEVFANFRAAVTRLRPPKRKRIILEWIERWSNLLSRESTFDPASIRRYERGDIIFADFGFKVGHEFGGLHYAVVIENDNAASNGTVVVVPMKSADNEEELVELDWKDVNLGKGVLPWKPDKYNIAKVNQVCALSKLRIVHPKSQSEMIINIRDQGLMDEIDKILIRLCTGRKK